MGHRNTVGVHFPVPNSVNVSCRFGIPSRFYHVFWFFLLPTAFGDLEQQGLLIDSHWISPLSTINRHLLHQLQTFRITGSRKIRETQTGGSPTLDQYGNWWNNSWPKTFAFSLLRGKLKGQMLGSALTMTVVNYQNKKQRNQAHTEVWSSTWWYKTHLNSNFWSHYLFAQTLVLPHLLLKQTLLLNLSHVVGN